ncbi:Zinc finger protein-like 1 homolog [Linum perenne]
MVVCKCRKATKLYCFVHKVPVCGECISFPEHQICVVRTYSEWVIDGGYDWPPKCCSCQAVLDEGSGETTRLGCMHVIHTNCLVSHVQSFPPHTAPAGYVCPSCSIPIWPPKNVKDSGSSFHSKLKEAIIQTGIEKNLFGNHPVSFPAPPPAFVSDPLVSISSSSLYSNISGKMPSMVSVPDIVEVDSPSSAANYLKNSSPAATMKMAIVKSTVEEVSIMCLC